MFKNIIIYIFIATLTSSSAYAGVDQEVAYIFNTFSFLVCGFLVMWMAAGFCMLESGLVTTRSVSTIAAKNIGKFAVVSVVFYFIGYNLGYGVPEGGFIGSLSIWSDSSSIETGYSDASDWFFQALFVCATASIVSGAVAERIKIWPFFAFAAILSPIFVGSVADRYFSAQKAMGALHIVGGLLLIYATQISSSILFIATVLVYSLMYMPTVALSNNIVFANVSDSGKTFPVIRFFGTFGWIVAGFIIGKLQLENNIGSIAYTFYLAAGASLILGLFSFSLPNVPPKGKTDGSPLGLEGLILLKDKTYLIFFISALAETNRPPFDLPEAEAELVAGYQTEYSGMMYAMFWLGEYANILLMCAMGAILFLGGWLSPVEVFPFTLVPGAIWLILKILLLFILFALVLSLIHICRCRRIERCRSRWSPYH